MFNEYLFYTFRTKDPSCVDMIVSMINIVRELIKQQCDHYYSFENYDIGGPFRYNYNARHVCQ